MNVRRKMECNVELSALSNIMIQGLRRRDALENGEDKNVHQGNQRSIGQSEGRWVREALSNKPA